MEDISVSIDLLNQTLEEEKKNLKGSSDSLYCKGIIKGIEASIVVLTEFQSEN